MCLYSLRGASPDFTPRATPRLDRLRALLTLQTGTRAGYLKAVAAPCTPEDLTMAAATLLVHHTDHSHSHSDSTKIATRSASHARLSEPRILCKQHVQRVGPRVTRAGQAVVQAVPPSRRLVGVNVPSHGSTHVPIGSQVDVRHIQHGEPPCERRRADTWQPFALVEWRCAPVVWVRTRTRRPKIGRCEAWRLPAPATQLLPRRRPAGQRRGRVGALGVADIGRPHDQLRPRLGETSEVMHALLDGLRICTERPVDVAEVVTCGRGV